MDVQSLLDLLNSAVNSKMGTAFAAFALAALVFALQKVSVVKNFVEKQPVLSKVSMVVLAVVPAVVMSLTSKASWSDALMTAVLTLLGALGLGVVKDVVAGLFNK